MIPNGDIDWWGCLAFLGLWAIIFGNDALDLLLDWRHPGASARRYRRRR